MPSVTTVVVAVFWGAMKVLSEFAFGVWFMSVWFLSHASTTTAPTGHASEDKQNLIGMIGVLILALQVAKSLSDAHAKKQDRLREEQRHRFDAEDRERLARENQATAMAAAEELRKLTKVRDDRVEAKLDQQTKLIAKPLLADGIPEHVKAEIRKELQAYDDLKRTPEVKDAENSIAGKVLQPDHRRPEGKHGGVLHPPPRLP